MHLTPGTALLLVVAGGATGRARGAAGVEPPWRSLVPNTDVYRTELGVLMEVLAVHRTARAAQSP